MQWMPSFFHTKKEPFVVSNSSDSKGFLECWHTRDTDRLRDIMGRASGWGRKRKRKPKPIFTIFDVVGTFNWSFCNKNGIYSLFDMVHLCHYLFETIVVNVTRIHGTHITHTHSVLISKNGHCILRACKQLWFNLTLKRVCSAHRLKHSKKPCIGNQ